MMPATQNEGWGFWGTMGAHADGAWPLAMEAVREATGEDGETVRAFLDSRYGRHFADEVLDGLKVSRMPLQAAITHTTVRWMALRIGKQTSREYGIPHGMAYLNGFVIHCGLIAETES